MPVWNQTSVTLVALPLAALGLALFQFEPSADPPLPTARESTDLQSLIDTDAPQPQVTTLNSYVDSETGDEVVEEWINGLLRSVLVRPVKGTEYRMVDTDGDGLIDHVIGAGSVRLEYRKRYRWDPKRYPMQSD
jgi:hypothetical protein